MLNKNTIIFCVLLLFVAVSISAKYYKFAIAKDFYVSSELNCDPETEACFIWDCNLTDAACDQTPYKYIWKYAANIPACDPRTRECGELQCQNSEDDCEVIHCSEETLGEEEYCTSYLDSL